MNGYYSKEVLRQENAVISGAATTVVSQEFRISPQGSLNFRVDVVVDSMTIATGVNFELFTTSGVDKDGNEDWQEAAKTVAFSSNGSYTLTFLVAKTTDQQYLPLRPKGRIVVNSGAGDSLTVKSIRIMQEE
jgi:hypothetical protein